MKRLGLGKSSGRRPQQSSKGADAEFRTDHQDHCLPPIGKSGGRHFSQPGRQTSAQHQQVHPGAAAAAKIKELSALDPGKALAATAEEWAANCRGDRALLVFLAPGARIVIAVIFIGARQHALLIMGHDASHYRYLPKRWQNELFANLFLMWPTFASVEGFRKFHGTHHQYTNLPNDGNRHIWQTHDAAGELAPDWQFPKTRAGLALRAVAPRRCS